MPLTTATDMPAFRAPPPAPAVGFDPGQFAGFEDILGEFFGFGDLFGGGGGRRAATRAQRGEDLPFELEISFEDMMKGMSADIQVPGWRLAADAPGRARSRKTA